MRIKIIFIAVFIFCIYSAAGAEELIHVPAAIQISSTVSDGEYSISQIIEIARKNGMKGVILTDRNLMRWEYGVWPLRNIIKKTIEGHSIFKYGIKRYFAEVEDLETKNKDIIVMPAMEVAPFYFWKGSLLRGDFKIMDWHKHFLVMGLDKFSDIAHLPVTGNIGGLTLPFRIVNIFYFLIPLLIIFLGVISIRRRVFNYRDSFGNNLGPYSRRFQYFGTALILSGLLFLFNNYPFKDLRFDQYHGDLAVMPYQNFIDYAKSRGAAVFWSHPEAENISQQGMVGIETREHTDYLLKTNGFTGFAYFYEGSRKVGNIGGIWDEILKRYCQGMRSQPVWAIAGLSFDYYGDLDKYMRDLRTVFLLRSFNKAGLLEALKKGRMYVLNGSGSLEFILDKFSVSDNVDKIQEALMGDEIQLINKPNIKISGHFISGINNKMAIKLIKNGRVIREFEVATPFDISYTDDSGIEGNKAYYRLEAESDNLKLISNPIFVRRE